MSGSKGSEYPKIITERAREFRKSPTPAENQLWRQLKSRKLGGYKFRRQHPIDRFVVDFVCLEEKLVLELDGGVHASQQDYDEARTLRLAELGFSVLRIQNRQIFANLDVVKEKILGVCKRPHPRIFID